MKKIEEIGSLLNITKSDIKNIRATRNDEKAKYMRTYLITLLSGIISTITGFFSGIYSSIFVPGLSFYPYFCAITTSPLGISAKESKSMVLLNFIVIIAFFVFGFVFGIYFQNQMFCQTTFYGVYGRDAE